MSSHNDAYIAAQMIAKFMPEEMVIDMLIKDLQEYKKNPKKDDKPMSMMMLLMMKWNKEGSSMADIVKDAEKMQRLKHLHDNLSSDN